MSKTHNVTPLLRELFPLWVRIKHRQVVKQGLYLWKPEKKHRNYYNDVMMSAMASQITSLTIVYSSVYSGGNQRKHKKLRVTCLCEGNSPVTGEFPAQKASNAGNVSIWLRHHDRVVIHNTTKFCAYVIECTAHTCIFLYLGRATMECQLN